MYQHTHTSADRLITIKCHKRKWDVQHRYTKNQTSVEHGNIIPWTDGTSTCHQITTARMHATSKTQKKNGSLTQYTSNTNESPIQPYTCWQSHACNTTGHKRNQETGRHRKFRRSTRPPTTCQRCKQLPTKHRSPQHSASSKGEPQPTLNRKWKTIRRSQNEAITSKGESVGCLKEVIDRQKVVLDD